MRKAQIRSQKGRSGHNVLAARRRFLRMGTSVHPWLGPAPQGEKFQILAVEKAHDWFVEGRKVSPHGPIMG